MAQSPSISGFEAAQKAINTLGLGFDLTQDTLTTVRLVHG
jgi:hypothetical protein